MRRIASNETYLQFLGLGRPPSPRKRKGQLAPKATPPPVEKRRRSTRVADDAQEKLNDALVAEFKQRHDGREPTGQEKNELLEVLREDPSTALAWKKLSLDGAQLLLRKSRAESEAADRAEAASAQEALKKLQSPQFWFEKAGMTRHMAEALAMIDVVVSVPWSVDEHDPHGKPSRLPGSKGPAALSRTRGGCAVTWHDATIICYSASNDKHLLQYRDGTKLWEPEVVANFGKQPRLTAADEKRLAATESESPFLAYVGTLDDASKAQLVSAYASTAASPAPPSLPTDERVAFHKRLDQLRGAERTPILDLLDREEREYFRARAGKHAERAVELVGKCRDKICASNAPTNVVAAKVLATCGAAVFVSRNTPPACGDAAASSTAERRVKCAIMETSTVPIAQSKVALLAHGMPKKENAFDVSTELRNREDSRLSLTDPDLWPLYKDSIFGLWAQVSTRTLTREIDALNMPHDLKTLSRAALRRLVVTVANRLSRRALELLLTFSCVLAYGHDDDEKESPLYNTCMALLYQRNRWQRQQANALQYESAQTSVIDLLGNVATATSGKTEEIASFFGMDINEQARQTAGLSTCYVMEGRRLARQHLALDSAPSKAKAPKQQSTPEEVTVMNWDTWAAQTSMVWATTLLSSLSPWQGCPQLTTLMAFTYDAGYQKGETPGQWRMLELGTQAVVRDGGFNILRTSQIPSRIDSAMAALSSSDVSEVLASLSTPEAVAVLSGDESKVGSLLASLAKALPTWASDYERQFTNHVRKSLAVAAGGGASATQQWCVRYDEDAHDAVVERVAIGLREALVNKPEIKSHNFAAQSRTLTSNGGHVGSTDASVVRSVEDTLRTAHTDAVRKACDVLAKVSPAARDTPDAGASDSDAMADVDVETASVVQLLLDAGAVPVETTTKAVAAVQQHELRQMLQLIETTARFPVLTLEGNLNCTPEKRVRFVECAGDQTMRRRLVLVQDETGLPPPDAKKRFGSMPFASDELPSFVVNG